MTEPADYSSWLTKQQAADAIGVTTKSIERFVQAGKIQQARWRPSGRGPELAVYEPSDVARVAAERPHGPLPPFLMPAPPTVPARQVSVSSTNGNGHHPETPVTSLTIHEPGAEFVRGLVAAISQVVSETSQTAKPTLTLTVEEAAVWANETPRDLRRAIRDGVLPCLHAERRDWRTWRIKRTVLEAFYE